MSVFKGRRGSLKSEAVREREPRASKTARDGDAQRGTATWHGMKGALWLCSRAPRAFRRFAPSFTPLLSAHTLKSTHSSNVFKTATMSSFRTTSPLQAGPEPWYAPELRVFGTLFDILLPLGILWLPWLFLTFVGARLPGKSRSAYVALSASASFAYAVLSLDLWERRIGCLGWPRDEPAGPLMSAVYVVFAICILVAHCIALAMAAFQSDINKVAAFFASSTLDGPNVPTSRHSDTSKDETRLE